MTRSFNRTFLSAAALTVLGAAVLLLGSCSPSGESIRDRIETFIDAVNDQEDQDIKDCLDSDADAYNEAGVSAFWDAYFPAPKSYSISSFSSSGDSATVIFNNGTDQSYDFDMTENSGSFFEGTTYSIRRVSNGVNGVIFE